MSEIAKQYLAAKGLPPEKHVVSTSQSNLLDMLDEYNSLITIINKFEGYELDSDDVRILMDNLKSLESNDDRLIWENARKCVNKHSFEVWVSEHV